MDSLFTLPVKHDSDSLDIRERVLFDSFDVEREKILKKLKMRTKELRNITMSFQLLRNVLDMKARIFFNIFTTQLLL